MRGSNFAWRGAACRRLAAKQATCLPLRKSQCPRRRAKPNATCSGDSANNRRLIRAGTSNRRDTVKAERSEAVWLTEDTEFSLGELAELAGVPEADVRELVEYGALSPIDREAPAWIFSGRCLVTVRTACRLRVSLDLEPHGVALTVSLLERIQ